MLTNEPPGKGGSFCFIRTYNQQLKGDNTVSSILGRVRGGALWSYVMSKITANTSVVYEITLESVPPIGIARDPSWIVHIFFVIKLSLRCLMNELVTRAYIGIARDHPLWFLLGKALRHRQRGLLPSVDYCNMLMAKVFGCTLM